MEIDIPFWVVIVILLGVGVAGLFIIALFEKGPYDFVTAFIAVSWVITFIMLAAGLAIGKYFF